MPTDPAYRKITADEFLAMDFGTDKKFELSDGVIYMMTGGTTGHAWVQTNILAWLRNRLRGTGCRPFGADTAVTISPTDVRYPDISVYCDHPPADEIWNDKAMSDPRVLVEVLSPSTTQFDQGTKLDEYQMLPSVRTIVFVDPVNEMCRTIERLGPREWHDEMFSGERGIPLPSLGLTIPHDEIFARD